jgi:hypothetical protein
MTAVATARKTRVVRARKAVAVWRISARWLLMPRISGRDG